MKEGACPLLILWPFSPVALVYDVDDTEGEPLPDSVLQASRAVEEPLLLFYEPLFEIYRRAI